MQTLKTLPHDFSICQLESTVPADLCAEYCFFAKTAEEISLVCPTAHTPACALSREDGWRAL